ncbi:MAG: D-alanyl-D-alanine carboxypeptidase [Saprospiraceae bacterium]
MKIRSEFRNTLYIVSCCCLSILILSCNSSKKSAGNTPNLPSLLEQSPVFNNHFTGFVLFDPVTQKTLYSMNGDKYFTPASNTKILTLYTALMLLPDTLPSVRMAVFGDSLIIKGMGDPTLFHELWPDHPVVNFLKQTNKKIYLVKDVLQDDVQGSGWAWDDFQDDYQAEKSALPLYGNLVKFTPTNTEHFFIAEPSYFQSEWSWTDTKNPDRKITRNIASNIFEVNSTFIYPYYIPYKSDMQVSRELLMDTLKKDVQLILSASLPTDIHWDIIKGIPADTVYAQMMKVSDNFIAEQLLLLTNSYLKDSCNSTQCIRDAKFQLFDAPPDTFQWYDGSGLSRYDLITPRTLVYILNKVMSRLTMDGIKKIFPTGGIGTLSKWYQGPSPYIYAKTGSLMNNHSLSGFIHTNKGHDLIFSFMHSNYTRSVNPIRAEMQKTLEFIRDNY